MAIPRQPGLRDPLVFHRQLQHCAGVELPHQGPLDFLPRRLRSPGT